jgi:hypothetical protein
MVAIIKLVAADAWRLHDLTMKRRAEALIIGIRVEDQNSRCGLGDDATTARTRAIDAPMCATLDMRLRY